MNSTRVAHTVDIKLTESEEAKENKVKQKGHNNNN